MKIKKYTGEISKDVELFLTEKKCTLKNLEDLIPLILKAFKGATLDLKIWSHPVTKKDAHLVITINSKLKTDAEIVLAEDKLFEQIENHEISIRDIVISQVWKLDFLDKRLES